MLPAFRALQSAFQIALLSALASAETPQDVGHALAVARDRLAAPLLAGTGREAVDLAAVLDRSELLSALQTAYHAVLGTACGAAAAEQDNGGRMRRQA